jgi:AAA domain
MAIIRRPVVDALMSELLSRQIDVLTVDPFISCHRVPENDNGAIDAVVKEWGSVAVAAKCCIKLVHHIRKTGDGDVTTESTRGAKAATDAARSVRVFRGMTDREGAKMGVDNHRRYFRVAIDKANMAPTSSKEAWFQLLNVALDNGDYVGVVAPWTPPDAFAGITVSDLLRCQHAIDGKNYRAFDTARDWVGHVIATVLDIDVATDAGKARIKQIIDTWLRNGALKKDGVTDKKTGRSSPCIFVGKWANED